MPRQPVTFGDDLVLPQARQAAAQWRKLVEIGRAINGTYDPRGVLELIVSSAIDLLDAQISWLGQFEGESSRYRFSAGLLRGGEPGVGEELGPEFAGEFELGHGPMVAQKLRACQPVLLPDIQLNLAGAPRPPYEERGWSMRSTLGRRGVRGVLIVPMLRHGSLRGFLGVGSAQPRDFQGHDVDLLTLLADYSIIAIGRSESLQRERDITRAEERNRMAREIHDTLAQGFTGIILQLEAAEQVLHDEPETAQTHLDRARTLARDSLQEARRSVWNLLPGPLERNTLDSAIFQEVQSLGTEGEAEVGFTATGEPYPLAVEAQTCLLRVTQEALGNIRKHAQARHVDVTLAWEQAGVSLTIRDDGRGFDPAALRGPSSSGGGFGLISMRERCQLANGVFTLESAPGDGTVIHVFLWVRRPLPERLAL